MSNTNNLLSTISINNETIYRNTQGVHDYAYDLGNAQGYAQGEMAGFEAGKEEEKIRTDVYVEKSKEAIIDQNGEISSDAGIEALPEAILSIPVSYTDDEIAYQKTVPMRAQAKSALLKRIGGMTYKCNNLFPILPWANRTIGGITFRLDENGVYHLSGTATETLFTALKLNLPVDKYTLSLNCNKQIGTGFTNAVYVTARSTDGEWRIVHSTHSSNAYTTLTTTVDIVDVTFAIMEGVNCDGLTVAPMINKDDYIPYEPYYEGLRDSKATEIVSHGANLLKEVYALGNTTVTNGVVTQISADTNQNIYFKCMTYSDETFVAEDVKYVGGLGRFEIAFEKTTEVNRIVFGLNGSSTDTTASASVNHLPNGTYLLSVDFTNLTQGSISWKDMMISKDSIPYAPYREPISKPIPKALRDIDGWGWGIPESANNYADFENEQFAKPIDKVVFNGTENYWVKFGDKQYGFVHSALATFAGSVCLADRFTFGYSEKSGTFFVGGSGVAFNTDFGTLDEWKTYLAEQYTNNTPVTMYYELAEPIITDISDILEDGNFIEVESGGSLEFVNEYKNAVPSTVKYTDVKVNSGKELTIDESKIIEKIATGTSTVALEDVSEIPHNVSVQLSSDTVTDFSTTSVEVFSGNSRNLGTLSFTLSLNYSFDPYLPAGKLFLSAIVTSSYTDSTKCILGVVDTNGNVTYPMINKSVNGERTIVTINAAAPVKSISFYAGSSGSNSSGQTATFEKIMIASELAYVEPAVYIPTIDGKIDGIKSFSPYMTFMCDGMDMSVSYHKSWGMQTEYERFWGSMFNYGNRKSFHVAFGGQGWNDYTFRPPYDIVATNTASSMFNNCSITNLAGILSSLGRKLDLSKATALSYCFSNSTITHLPWLDTSSTETLESLCSGCTKLVSIEGITVSETLVQTFPSSFRACKALEHIRWDGGSIKTDVDLSAAVKLDRASIANTIKALHSFEKEGTLVTPEDSSYIEGTFSGDPMLIKLVDVPQNVKDYTVGWYGSCYEHIDNDPETGDPIYDYVPYGGTYLVNELGEIVIYPYAEEDLTVEAIDAEGERVAYSYHWLDYDHTPTVTFSKQAVDKAFETSEGANNGSKSSAWYSLVDSRPYTTISLI